MNFSVTRVLGKNTVISNSENKVFSQFSVGPVQSLLLGVFLPILTNPVLSTMGCYHTAML